MKVDMRVGIFRKNRLKKKFRIDTITTKLLLLVLFTTIIPLFTITSFSIKLFSTVVSNSHYSVNLILFIFIIALFVSVIFAIVFSRTLTTPILKLMEAANIVSEGNLDYEVSMKGNDEIARLAKAFNIMTRRLKQQQQFRDNFIAALTHDLKVPMLAENQTISYLLKETYGPITDEQKEVLEIIKSTNASSLEMISTLLDVHKYDLDKATIYKEDFDLIELFKVAVIEIKSLAEEKNILLKIETDFENIMINAAKMELKRVFHNLISNAISNSRPKSSISCKVILNKQDSLYLPKDTAYKNTTLTNPLHLLNTVIIKIEDNGTGLSKEDMPFLFKRFSLSKDRKPSGTGIGLYYSYQVITRHNGHIWCESTEGQGSSFNILIPLG
jgi:signal transduction histidine kinase